MYCTPGPLNSILIKTENAVPISPEKSANIKYKVPISLALVDQNHRSVHKDTEAIFRGSPSSLKPNTFILIFIYL